ncbi:MAG: MarR family transcriptional regulator [Candidatus Nanoarchaeia archaeon]
MDMYKVKWTRLQTQIFRFLCIKAGQQMNVREIARNLSVSPTAVSKSLKDLEKEKLIKIVKSKTINQLSIEFNRDSNKAIEMKRVENLKLVYEAGIVTYLHEKFPGCTIFLFGSYSLGEDVLALKNPSDVDIAIVGTKGKEIDLIRYNKLLERDIIINFYGSWGEIHKNLRNNILNGILLKGCVDL